MCVEELEKGEGREKTENFSVRAKAKTDLRERREKRETERIRE